MQSVRNVQDNPNQLMIDNQFVTISSRSTRQSTDTLQRKRAISSPLPKTAPNPISSLIPAPIPSSTPVHQDFISESRRLSGLVGSTQKSGMGIVTRTS